MRPVDTSEIQAEIQQAEAEKRQLDEGIERLDRLKNERPDLEQCKATLESKIEEKEQELEEKSTELEKCESSVEESRERENELDEAFSKLQDAQSELGDVKFRLEKDLESNREDVQDRLTDLRTRIERLEKEAVEAFNDHMQTILEYKNLARSWIERTEQTVREGRRKVTRGSFELHVVRATEDGTTYEDTVDHLSESERKVTGLVFALAGYLVHDVHETVPFMLLDSLEAIDSERIARLVDFFKDYPDYLVVALLPEDAQALDEDHRRITEI